MTGRTPPHVGLAMKPNEFGIHDLYLDAENNLGIVSGPEAVGQHIRQRLMTYAGEWFLNIEIGMTWLEEIMAHRYNPALAEALIKNETFNTDGVTGINSFSIAYDRYRRDLMVRGMEVATEYDEQSIWISNVGINV